jgi:hypothetical protein
VVEPPRDVADSSPRDCVLLLLLLLGAQQLMDDTE